MSTEVSKKKSGRTPEQQAARDARKAAKAAAAAAATVSASASTEDPAQPHAESSKQAMAATSPPPRSEKKRRRSEREDGQDQVEAEKEGEVVNEEDLLEIDVDAPEPLSKAEARAARKRQKKGLPELPPKITKPDKPKKHESDDEEEEGEKKEKKEEKKPKQRMNSVWIGNLSFRTTAESLKAYLEKGITEKGGVGHGAVTRVNLPKKPGKGEFAPNKGFAYVDFATPELQDLGVALSETFFEGRKLLIKKGDDHTVKADARTPRPERAKLDPMSASILKKQIHPESATLFVGNLPFDATEEALRDMIEDHAAELPAPAVSTPATAEDVATENDGEVAAEADGDQAEGEASAEKKVESVNPRGGKKSGLRKVRLGAFEDTGRCKGFAFLDFHTPQEATKTLVNRKNHFFGNRKLNVQYASESATKRSGGNRNQEPTGAPKPKRYFAAPTEGADDNTAEEVPTYAGHPKAEEEDKKKDHRGKRWEASGRPRPGAALAMAKREKVGIVKAEGAKIVFD